jgi:hypothetical protein
MRAKYFIVTTAAKHRGVFYVANCVFGQNCDWNDELAQEYKGENKPAQLIDQVKVHYGEVSDYQKR